MDCFRINLRKKIDKYIKLNNLTYRSFRNNGLGDPTSIIKRGSTTFENLFDISKYLELDVRNLLMFNDNTYEFENSFETFEEFFLFLGKRFKKFRMESGLRAIDIDNSSIVLYAFENCRKIISLNKFYIYLDKLGITSDEFFLDGEEYKIIQKESEEVEKVNYSITFEDVFRRVEELEDIRGVKIAKSVIPTRSMMPTIHVFLNICKSLKVSPSDFMDFDNKNPDYQKLKIDNREYISNLRKTIGADKENSQKFLRLDNIFNYCNHNNIDVQLFLNSENKYTTDNQYLAVSNIIDIKLYYVGLSIDSMCV